MNWKLVTKFLLGGILFAILLSVLSFLYINNRVQEEDAQLNQAREKICNRLIEANMISAIEECGSGTNPNLYLPILFPEGISLDYVSTGMQDFELHRVSRFDCERYFYVMYDFIFLRLAEFTFCDNVLVRVAYE